ncbi:hypothetical protein [Brevundimonas sp.]|uniref:hypothetical protein n=1 Tax=Brevundimonas sp. TaxID=1871086 RepID=UPI002EDB20E8
MTTPTEVLEADSVRLIVDFIDWVDDFTGTIPEAQSDKLFALYARARSFYFAADPAGHDAQREARIRQASRRGGEA